MNLMKNILFFSALMLIFCSSVQAAGSDPHWSYEGDEGPEHWAELSAKYALCRDGMNQSPVDLVADYHVDLPELVFEYHGTPEHPTASSTC